MYPQAKEVIELVSNVSRKRSADSSAAKESAVQKAKKKRRTKGPSEKIRSLAAMSLASKVGYLKLSDLLETESPKIRAMVEEHLTKRTFKSGETIYPNGRSESVIYVVRSGSVNIVRPSKLGHRFSVTRLEPGAIFGEMAILGQSMLGAQAEAAEKSEVARLSAADLEKVISASPSIALNVLEKVGPRLVEAEKQRERAAFQPVTARVASLLSRYANKDKQVVGVTHQDMADELGVYRETVTNALAELKQDKLISIGRKRITLLDPDALRKLDSF